MGKKTIYVVTQPKSVRGVYDTWPECEAAVRGMSGARFQKVKDRSEADAMLSGEGIVLPDGLYAFVDGNHLGGVGVVIVTADDGELVVVQEVGTSVRRVVRGKGIGGLETDQEVEAALRRSGNIVAEQAAGYMAIRKLPSGAEATIVHDLLYLKDWMIQRPPPRQWPLLMAARRLAKKKGLTLRFVHQHGHRSTWAGRHDFARFNGRADELTRMAAERPTMLKQLNELDEMRRCPDCHEGYCDEHGTHSA